MSKLYRPIQFDPNERVLKLHFQADGGSSKISGPEVSNEQVNGRKVSGRWAEQQRC